MVGPEGTLGQQYLERNFQIKAKRLTSDIQLDITDVVVTIITINIAHARAYLFHIRHETT